MCIQTTLENFKILFPLKTDEELSVKDCDNISTVQKKIQSDTYVDI